MWSLIARNRQISRFCNRGSTGYLTIPRLPSPPCQHSPARGFGYPHTDGTRLARQGDSGKTRGRLHETSEDHADRPRQLRCQLPRKGTGSRLRHHHLQVFAERVNLHRANVIVNYDTPWNCTRLMQRIGRVNRIGTKATHIFIYNFYPTSRVDEDIELRKKPSSSSKPFTAPSARTARSTRPTRRWKTSASSTNPRKKASAMNASACSWSYLLLASSESLRFRCSGLRAPPYSVSVEMRESHWTKKIPCGPSQCIYPVSKSHQCLRLRFSGSEFSGFR